MMISSAEAEVTVCCPSTEYKPLGWGTTLSKTHDMPKKSRAAREEPDKLFAILAEYTEFAEFMRILRSIATNVHKRLSRTRKSSIMPKLRLVRLSEGKRGISGRHGQDSLVECIRFP